MAIPEWADEALSRDLPVLRSRGESQELEYKSEFPSNVRDLGKEIAAFATSNTGTILLGVADTGNLIGLDECQTPEGRDQLIRRLEGIAKGTVKPSITPVAKFAVESEAVVLVISVPKGFQPVYYSNNTPYIRHLTQACPAEPHEVIERISEYLSQNLSSSTSPELDERSEFYSKLARILADILVIVDEAGERDVNPWLNMWRSEFGYAASELRDLAVTITALNESLVDNLKELADRLDEVVNMEIYIGSDSDIDEGVRRIGKIASKLFERRIDEEPLAEDALNQVRELVRATALKLQDLLRRSDEMLNSGRIKELQSQASELGRPIARVARYKIDALGEGVRERLATVARTLRLIETMRLYMDGGISMRAIVDRISECSNEFNQIAQEIQ